MIVVRLMGGLGNQLFQYAAGRRLAEVHKTVLKLDLTFLLDRTPKENFTFRDFDLPIFNIQENIATPEEVRRHYNFPKRLVSKFIPSFPNSYVKEKYFHFDPAILELGNDCYLDGHWTSEKYFQDILPVLRRELTFKHPMDDRGHTMAAKIKSVNSICLNVRRGDYVTNPDINAKIGVKGLDYFACAVEMIKKEVKNPELFIFSDDIDWCVQNLKFDVPAHIVDHSYKGLKFQQYLHLMSLCQHFVIPNSSFAWWGAWLGSHNQKIVITPKKWFNDPTLNDKDLRPEGWMAI